MRKRILTLALALILCMTLFPATALAETYTGNGITVTVTETSITADTASNTEGYGSLKIEQTADAAPRHALIDSSGNMVFDYGRFPCRIFLHDGIFANGIVQEIADYGAIGVYSLFDLTGKQIIPETYDYLNYYNGYGHAVVVREDSAWDGVDRFLIDKTGEKVVTMPSVFNIISSFGEGNYMLEQHLWSFSYYGRMGGYSDGLLWFYTGADIKSNISEVNSLTEADVSRDSINSMVYGGAYGGYMDLDGNVVISQQYNSVYPFVEGLAAVEGNLVTAPQEWYGRIENITSGKYGYIDKTGKTVIDFQYSNASSFVGGYANVANDAGKYGYIDKTGKVAVPLVYDSAFGAGDGLFSVGNIVGKTTNSVGYEIDRYKHGYVDVNGNVVVPLEFDDVSPFINGVAYAIKDRKVHILKIGNTQADGPSDWAVEEINAAIEAGLVPENLQKNYQNALPRGSVVQMFINLIEKSTGQSIEDFMEAKGVKINNNAFTDTNDKAVLAANALGIINGVGNGKFEPDSTLTRAHVAALINRVANLLGISTEGYTHNFTDVSGHWASPELGWPVYVGGINGVGDNRFEPDEPLTNEHVIAAVYRSLLSFVN